MGGLPCAKQIIDGAFAIMRALGCMATSILLAASTGTGPTQEQADRFRKAGDSLAELAAEIEKSMREGGGISAPLDRIAE